MAEGLGLLETGAVFAAAGAASAAGVAGAADEVVVAAFAFVGAGRLGTHVPFTHVPPNSFTNGSGPAHAPVSAVRGALVVA